MFTFREDLDEDILARQMTACWVALPDVVFGSQSLQINVEVPHAQLSNRAFDRPWEREITDLEIMENIRKSQ